MNAARDPIFARFHLARRCSLRVEQVPRDGAFALDELAPVERERLKTFASSERRRQFVLGRLAVRRLVGEMQGEVPVAVRMDVGDDGAPRVKDGYVSIAHGGLGFEAIGLAAYAERPVGVDVEQIRVRHARLADRILRADEAHVLPSIAADSDSALTLVWALKESVLKGQRTGLRAGAQSVRLDRIQVASSRGEAQATSEASGAWHLGFERIGDLWLAVATTEGR